MTKTEALYNFYSSFDIPAYPTNKVPKDTEFPFLTYEPITSNLYGQSITYPTVSLWYFDTKEKGINAKAEEIAKAIGSGVTIPCDDGIILIYFSGLWTPITDELDATIKRRQTNLQVEFITI